MRARLISSAAVVGALGLLGLFWLVTAAPPASPDRDGADVPLSVPGVLAEERERTSARAAAVINAETGSVLFEERAFGVYPVASLTKLMSAVVTLDRKPDLDARVAILPTEYTIRGGNLRLQRGETVTLRDLLVASIAASANNAAFALPRAVGLTDEEFVGEMNRKAVALSFESLRFVDAAGFSPENVGSAYDVARLAAHALAQYPLIAEAARTREYHIAVRGSGREHVLRHSNPLLAELDPGTESKTGYLNEALYCLVLTQPRGASRLVAVLLGHPTEIGVIREAAALLEVASARVAGASAPP